jgi:hypothetical protein
MFADPDRPSPPATFNAPVVALTDAVVLVMFTAPVNVDAPDTLRALDNVVDWTTLSDPAMLVVEPDNNVVPVTNRFPAPELVVSIPCKT